MGFRLTEQEAWEKVATAHESVLTTLRADGRPVSLPVWHVAVDGAVYVRTPRRSKKMIRVGNDPRGSLLVSTGTAWAELEAVVLEVRIEVVDDDDEAARATAAIAQKYDGMFAPQDQLPAAVVATYDDMAVLRLEPCGRPLTWSNAALLQR